MMQKPLRVLIVEDLPTDAELIVLELQKAGFAPNWCRVDTEAAYVAGLRPDLDVILSDFAMPRFSGIRAIEILQERGLEIPLIIISGAIGEETAVAAMKKGATDYLLKDRLARLGVAIKNALERRQLLRQPLQVDAALRLFRTLVDQSNDTFEIIDPETACFLDVNDNGPAQLGCTRAEYLSLRVMDIDPTINEFIWLDLVERIRSCGSAIGEGFHRRKDGTVFPVEIHTRWVHLDRDYIVAVVRDITERQKLAKDLRESEKRFRQLTQAIEQVFWMTDASKTEMLYISPGYERIWGRTCQALYDSPGIWLDAIHPGDHPRIVEAISSKPIITKYDLEYRIIRPDGSERWIRDRAFPIRDAAGKVHRIAGIAEDITERKHAKMAFVESKQRLEGIVGSAMDAIISVNADQRIVLWNAAAEKIFRCAASEAIGSPINRFIPRRFGEAHTEHIRHFSATAVPSRMLGQRGNITALSGLRSDGEEFPVEVSISQVMVGSETLFTVVLRDITMRLRDEQRMHDLQHSTAETLALLDTLQHHAPIGIAFVDREYRIIRINEELAANNGLPVEAHIGRTVAEVLPELWPRLEPEFRQVIESGQPVIESELSGVTPEKPDKMRHWVVSYYPVFLHGCIAGVGVIVLEVTERKRLELEVLAISEFEQRRIGQDLHDDLCQHLVALQMFSELLARNLTAKSLPEAETAAHISKGLRESIERARMLARGLSPVTHASDGLILALKGLAENSATLFQIQCECRFDLTLVLKDTSAATHLYRIVQEAITNAVKHGRAKKIVLAVTARPDDCQLMITDNGSGFSETAGEHEGMGLRTMKYRAAMIGASLEVRPVEDKGTSVICTIPTSLLCS